MEKIIRTIQQPIQSNIKIPGSKSMTNRALLLAAMSNGICEISDVLISDDTRVFADALSELGIMVQLDESTRTCIVGGVTGRLPKPEASIWCGDAATAARFLLAICAASPGNYFFDGSPQLRNRPLSPLIKVLVGQGAVISPKNANRMPLTIKGVDRFSGDVIEIEGTQTGQFISALLMAAPFSKTQMVIQTSDLVSRPYVDMTMDMMADFGVLVRRMNYSRFSIPVPQYYQARDYVIEPDLSTASYFFAAAAVTGGEVTIQPINRNKSHQGDVQFVKILEKMGCQIIENGLGLTVKGPTELKGVSVDMRDFSDTFMTLAAIAPFAKTPTSITNIGHTRLQESDRIKVMRTELEKCGVKVEEGPDWLKIFPSTPHGAVIDSHQDHRIAMSFAILGLKVENIVIQGAECVTKTCPNFYDLWEQLY